MIKSMTGFGKGEASGKVGRFTVEIRTVNHRYFDLSSRLPANLSQLEDKIKIYINKYIKRGKINFSLSHRKSESDINSIKLDDEAIVKYHRMLNRICAKFKLKDDIKLSHILSFPDVIIREESKYDPNLVWAGLEPALKKALLDCDRMRAREGRALYRDLTKRMARISRSINNIYRLSPRLISEFKHKLDSRIKDILKSGDYDIDRSRLETEIAIFARQSDIAEEITRARSHLKEMENTLVSNKEAGRRLDFILQELQREINTLGSKASSGRISQLVIDIKSEIEKMREQSQNVE